VYNEGPVLYGNTMALDPLDPPFADYVNADLVCEVANGWVHIFDLNTHHGIRMSESDFGRMFDKWMIARLSMNQRKEPSDEYNQPPGD
jgi:hypothetical protein